MSVTLCSLRATFSSKKAILLGLDPWLQFELGTAKVKTEAVRKEKVSGEFTWDGEYHLHGQPVGNLKVGRFCISSQMLRNPSLGSVAVLCQVFWGAFLSGPR
jgi:hypothetical protein